MGEPTGYSVDQGRYQDMPGSLLGYQRRRKKFKQCPPAVPIRAAKIARSLLMGDCLLSDAIRRRPQDGGADHSGRVVVAAELVAIALYGGSAACAESR